jgi:hypothetical protein
MELRHIRYFLAVAEEQNFTRAAARVGIGQPPLSQQIKDLEMEVGAPLFHRIPQGAELTEAGRAFLENVRVIPVQTERATRAAQRAARGEIGSIRVGFVGSAPFNRVMPATIRSFRRAYPDGEMSFEESNAMRLTAQTLGSRSVSASSAPCATSASAISAGIRLRPACTTRMDSGKSFQIIFFSKYPVAPALSARTLYHSWECNPWGTPWKP